jgi:tricarballylate dehydrogenase
LADLSKRYDVLIVGGGNAGLCAAIAARRAGASVLVLEAAPKFYRGGNTRHTRNMRCAHDAATDTLSGPYTEEEFFDDLLRVTGGNTDADLARLMIAESKDLLPWIAEQGVRFQPSLGGTLSLGRTNSFFLGGGRAMLNALYRTAEKRGVEICYDAEVTGLDIGDGVFNGAHVRMGGETVAVHAVALVAASGGFEANIDWLKQGWGAPAENFLVRGTPYNKGVVLKALMAGGVQMLGDPTQCHAVAIDARAPKFDGGIITRLDCVVFGVVVNRAAQRFYDEGEDIWPKRYAIWGRLVAQQPDQIAYSWPRRSSWMRRCWKRRWPNSMPPCGPARSMRRCSTIAAPRAWSRPNPIGPSASKPRRSTPIRCAPASPLPISRPRWTVKRGSSWRTALPRRTCSPPARPWPGTYSAAAMPPASA